MANNSHKTNAHKHTLTIATRESALALWQAEFVAAKLRELDSELEVVLLGMTTKGDQWLSSPLSEVGGKGLFVKELEQAMRDSRADIAVHSCKDLPAELPEGFRLAATGYRADVRDALVSPRYGKVSELPQGAVVGTSSLRRGSQLLARRPDLTLKPVRGNVGTRLGKLDAGDYDALVLAAAGLDRLELGARITERFSVAESLPAAGQGALSIECLTDAPEWLVALLARLNDYDVDCCVRAERAVSAALGADCSMPLAAHAVRSGEKIELQAIVGALDGTELVRAQASGNLAAPESIGAEAAAALIENGAEPLLLAARQIADQAAGKT